MSMSGSQSEPFVREYQALQTGNAYFDLRDWSSISVTGADRKPFLHNFSTNDVKGLAPGESCEAFFTNVKGKIVGHGLINCRDDEFVIFGPPGQAPHLIEHLDRYIIREDVQLVDRTAERRDLLLASDLREPAGTFAWSLIGRSGERILELLATDLAESEARLLKEGFTSVGAEAFNAARIEAGFPLYGLDFNDENLPQEVNRDRQAISFTKGCYLGQETVARIDALGHVNQKLARARFAGPAIPPRDTELIANGRTIGRVMSAAFSPKFAAPLALAMIRREANAPGTRLSSSVGECEVVAS
jgi:folate-binding protein YgfZ